MLAQSELEALVEGNSLRIRFFDKSIFRGIAVCSLLLRVGELQLKKWTVGMMCFIAVLSRRVAKPNSSAIAYQQRWVAVGYS